MFCASHYTTLPIKKLTHSFYELCESNLSIYFYLVIFHNSPDDYTHYSLPVLSNSHTHQSRSPMQTVFQKTYVRDFFSYYSFIIIYLCKLFFQNFLELGGIEPTLPPSHLARCEEQFLRDLVCYLYTINSLQRIGESNPSSENERCRVVSLYLTFIRPTPRFVSVNHTVEISCPQNRQTNAPYILFNYI